MCTFLIDFSWQEFSSHGPPLHKTKGTHSSSSNMTIHSRNFYFQEDASCSSTVTAEPQKRRKRKISFRPQQDQVFTIPHIDDLSEAEVADVWYGRTDYDTMKHSFIPIIRKMTKGEKVDETNRETTRGLEFRTRQGAIRRQHNKLEAISAVLDEQELQHNMGMRDDEKLRKVYLSCSLHCSDAAYQLGIQDENYIIEMLRTDDRSTAELSSLQLTAKKKRGVKIRTRSLVEDLKNLALSRRAVSNIAA
jgi:hypothetical protein